MLQKAYSFLQVKSVDHVKRVISGFATTPEPDRVGDVIESKGVTFASNLPFLLYHDRTKPVGQVRFQKARTDGVPFQAELSKVDRPGAVQDRIAEAWDSLSADPPLITAVSIGFRPLEPPTFNKQTGGYIFSRIELLELSLVTIPANADATIASIKSFDVDRPAASGTGRSVPVVKAALQATRAMQQTITEQIRGFEATRQAKSARMVEIMTKAGETGETLNDDQSGEYDGLDEQVKSIDAHLTRLNALEETNKKAAKPVHGETAEKAAATRGGEPIRLQRNLPPGIEFAQAIMCKIASFVALQRGEPRPSTEFAKQWYPDNPRIALYLKATVAPGTTTDATWAGPLVDPTNLSTEFIEYLRPMTIIGNPAFVSRVTNVPFNVRIIGQTSGGEGYWVGEAKPKPLTKFDFAPTTLTFAKAASISVISEELARFSTPSAEMLVRNALAKAIVARIDTDLIDPGKAAVAGVSPASLTNGVTPIASAGTTPADVLTDLQALLAGYLASNQNIADLVLIMPSTLALSVSLMRTDMGAPVFAGMSLSGGSLEGIPVVVTQYASHVTAGNLVIAVNGADVLVADDGQVSVDVSREASLEMLNTTLVQSPPTGAALVSLWQNNLIGLKAERYITWAKSRPGAVTYLEQVDWGGGAGVMTAAVAARKRDEEAEATRRDENESKRRR